MSYFATDRQAIQDEFTEQMRRGINAMTTEPEFTIDSPTGHITRDGRKAEILRRNGAGDRPIIALIDDGSHNGCVAWYSASGRWSNEESKSDLINAPAPKRMVKLYWHKTSGPYSPSGTYIDVDIDSPNARDTLFAITEIEIPARGTGLEGGE
jgi:hypothetical protein